MNVVDVNKNWSSRQKCILYLEKFERTKFHNVNYMKTTQVFRLYVFNNI